MGPKATYLHLVVKLNGWVQDSNSDFPYIKSFSGTAIIPRWKAIATKHSFVLKSSPLEFCSGDKLQATLLPKWTSELFLHFSIWEMAIILPLALGIIVRLQWARTGSAFGPGYGMLAVTTTCCCREDCKVILPQLPGIRAQVKWFSMPDTHNYLN